MKVVSHEGEYYLHSRPLSTDLANHFGRSICVQHRITLGVQRHLLRNAPDPSNVPRPISKIWLPHQSPGFHIPAETIHRRSLLQILEIHPANPECHVTLRIGDPISLIPKFGIDQGIPCLLQDTQTVDLLSFLSAPVIPVKAKRILGDAVDLCDTPDATLKGAEALLVCTAWSVYRQPGLRPDQEPFEDPDHTRWTQHQRSGPHERTGIQVLRRGSKLCFIDRFRKRNARFTFQTYHYLNDTTPRARYAVVAPFCHVSLCQQWQR